MTDFKGEFSKGYAAKVSRTNSVSTADQAVIKEMYKALVVSKAVVRLIPQREYIIKLGDAQESLKGIRFKVDGLPAITKLSLLYADIARISNTAGSSITEGECDEAGEYIAEEGDTESFYSKKFPPIIVLTPEGSDGNKMDWRRRQDGTTYYALREYADYTTWPAFLKDSKQADPENARMIKEGGDIQPAIADLTSGKFKDKSKKAIKDFPIENYSVDTIEDLMMPQLELTATLSWTGEKAKESKPLTAAQKRKAGAKTAK